MNVPVPLQQSQVGPSTSALARDPVALAPALAAIAYPFLLQGFHAAVSATGGVSLAAGLLASLFLLGAFSAPALGLAFALRAAGLAHPSRFQLRARHLAYLSVAAPPLFVFIAFLLSILGHPLPEAWAWVILWSAVALWVWTGRNTEAPEAPSPPGAKLRVAHGVVAAIVVAYIAFHLANHLLGLISPDAHAVVMKLGRKVYRAPAIEPLLVTLLLFQVAVGGWMAWRWSVLRIDRYRVFQVASGVYLWFFILTHMNSALVSARAIHGIDTGWGWASGAPTGLIHDAWNIRLVPHYALGVFFILSHLASGLRGVLIAHGVRPAFANRAWAAGLLASALVSAAIMAGLCGIRIDTGS
jgi:hypothetical protein